mmetsp:Transcript_3987/g.8216  ORF Transcript_3987/g.8216 Transcript_3987/m.8216 type:complete len:239 (-) Transcript_3987:40-756(-)
MAFRMPSSAPLMVPPARSLPTAVECKAVTIWLNPCAPLVLFEEPAPVFFFRFPDSRSCRMAQRLCTMTRPRKSSCLHIKCMILGLKGSFVMSLTRLLSSTRMSRCRSRIFLVFRIIIFRTMFSTRLLSPSTIPKMHSIKYRIRRSRTFLTSSSALHPSASGGKACASSGASSLRASTYPTRGGVRFSTASVTISELMSLAPWPARSEKSRKRIASFSLRPKASKRKRFSWSTVLAAEF